MWLDSLEQSISIDLKNTYIIYMYVNLKKTNVYPNFIIS